MRGEITFANRVREVYIAAMSRTQVRVILILIAFILIVAAILSGILTYWVGAESLPASTPEGGDAGQTPAAASRFLLGYRVYGRLVFLSTQSPITDG